MSSPKPTLGYASRTEAAIALQAEGLSPRQIAEKIGVTTGNVHDLIRSGLLKLGRLDVPSRGPRGSTAALEASVMDAWDAGLSIEQIATKLEISRDSASKTLAYMREGISDRAMTPKTLVSSSDALVAAILRAHPDAVEPKPATRRDRDAEQLAALMRGGRLVEKFTPRSRLEDQTLGGVGSGML